MNDIEDLEDIKYFVDTFYGKIRADELLAPVFALRIHTDHWQVHLNRMYDFWNTVLFFQRAYKGNPFPKHVGLPIEAKHFQQWTTLFKATIDEAFTGPRAEETKNRVDKMALLFMRKLDYLKNNPDFTSIM